MESNGIDTFCVSEQDLSLYGDLEEFILSSPFTHFRQFVSWMQCNRGCEAYIYIISRKNKKIVAASLVRQRKILLIGKSKYFIDRGPVVSEIKYLSVHLNGIKNILKKTALWIRINPYTWGGVREEAARLIEDNEFSKMKATVYSETIVLDLDQPERDLWKGLRRALKTQINKADKLGIKIEHVRNESGLRAFVKNHNVFAIDKSIPQIPMAIAQLLYKKIFSDGAYGSIWLARYKGKIVSGAAVIYSIDRAIYEWGFNNLNPGDIMIPASHKLHWEAICWAKRKGLKFYDFGGYNSTAGKNYGLNHFKLGFSKQKQKIMPEYRFVCHPFWSNLSDAIDSLRKH